jgi:hypothetical protein
MAAQFVKSSGASSMELCQTRNPGAARAHAADSARTHIRQGCHKPIARSPSATADSPNVPKNATLWTLSPAKSTVCTLKDLQTVPRD